MISKRIRIAAAALGATASIAVAAGPAYAAVNTGANATTHQAPSRTTIVYVDAAPTGDGPANQAECDKWAFNINFYGNLAENAGSDEEAERYAQRADELESQAMDRGCFIID